MARPTTRAECTARQAYDWSEGRAIFASGSPFEPLEVNGRLIKPGQSNNSYIFPGIGLGVVVSGTRIVTDEMFLAAARTLANTVSESGTLYPPLANIRAVSLEIAIAVADIAFDNQLTKITRPKYLDERIREEMYDPRY